MGSYMKETNSQSKGLIPLLKMTDCFVAATKQDSGNRRQTAVAVYNELWHPDLINFLKMRRPGTDETDMAKYLFFGLWVNDLFMERLVENGTWTLMCPKRCPGLSDLYGEEFKKKYEEYERTMPDLPKIQCKKLWSEIIVAQIETGLPFMCFKDAVNYKSNQKHIGTIRCSNLCTEIMEYSSSDETAVCNLASVAVNMYVDKETRTFDFGKMTDDVRIVTKNLDNVIDRTRYPTEEARRSILRHRPVGIGIQGLADAFMLMGMVYGDPESMILNRRIAEHIYYAAVEASCDLAKERGTYPAFEGSPASQGLLQFDLWRDEQERKTARGFTTKFRPIVTELDWDMLKRDKLLKHGMRNSYVVAPMPTASTAQILGNNESFEPFTSNLYTRNVMNGMFKVVNKHLFRHLFENNMWSPGWGDLMLDTHGSVQDIEGLDEHTKKMFRTVWEMPQKMLVDMAIDRAPFVDQSQSLNVFMDEDMTDAFGKLTKLHMYTWRMGLKTGMYYLRTPPPSNATQFAVDHDRVKQTRLAVIEVANPGEMEARVLTATKTAEDRMKEAGKKAVAAALEEEEARKLALSAKERAAEAVKELRASVREAEEASRLLRSIMASNGNLSTLIEDEKSAFLSEAEAVSRPLRSITASNGNLSTLNEDEMSTFLSETEEERNTLLSKFVCRRDNSEGCTACSS
ncbi:hypothetical protein Pcinc_011784 [Petrolisthes cinctipes]|uniref:Ribonucleotide reductase large subunit C-terminal domain-containing protein n=1 Tax=Petrolisthes cinctipes TaxID=88211 RepID=A0AAE1KT53_PETCI|nr:hypothetical protein Pcinc_011784 [Petrolisthes cinctipes]